MNSSANNGRSNLVIGILRTGYSRVPGFQIHVCYSLNSLKGGYIGDYKGEYYGG